MSSRRTRIKAVANLSVRRKVDAVPRPTADSTDDQLIKSEILTQKSQSCTTEVLVENTLSKKILKPTEVTENVINNQYENSDISETSCKKTEVVLADETPSKLLLEPTEPFENAANNQNRNSEISETSCKKTEVVLADETPSKLLLEPTEPFENAANNQNRNSEISETSCKKTEVVLADDMSSKLILEPTEAIENVVNNHNGNSEICNGKEVVLPDEMPSKLILELTEAIENVNKHRENSEISETCNGKEELLVNNALSKYKLEQTVANDSIVNKQNVNSEMSESIVPKVVNRRRIAKPVINLSRRERKPAPVIHQLQTSQTDADCSEQSTEGAMVACDNAVDPMQSKGDEGSSKSIVTQEQSKTDNSYSCTAFVSGITPLANGLNDNNKCDSAMDTGLTVETSELGDLLLRPPPSPSKNRQRIRPTPRLGIRRNSFQGSASESEDESRRYLSSSQTANRIHMEPPNAQSNNNDSASDNPQSPQKLKQSKRAKVHRTESTRKLAEARRDFVYRFGCKTPDRNRLTMFDMIFYNPHNSPMKKPELKDLTAPQKVLPDDEENVDDPENVPDQEPEEEEEEEEETPVLVPQLKLGPNGEIVIDEQSLVIETTGTKKGREEMANSTVVIDNEFNTKYGVYKKYARPKDWSFSETVRFYRILNTVGTDFSIMLQLFPGRSRRDLKLKFKREEKKNQILVDKVLMHPQDFNFENLEEQLKKEEEKLLEKEQKRLKEIEDKKRIKKDMKEKHKEINKKYTNKKIPLAQKSLREENGSINQPVLVQSVYKRRTKPKHSVQHELARGILGLVENTFINNNPEKVISDETNHGVFKIPEMKSSLFKSRQVLSATGGNEINILENSSSNRQVDNVHNTILDQDTLQENCERVNKGNKKECVNNKRKRKANAIKPVMKLKRKRVTVIKEDSDADIQNVLQEVSSDMNSILPTHLLDSNNEISNTVGEFEKVETQIIVLNSSAKDNDNGTSEKISVDYDDLNISESIDIRSEIYSSETDQYLMNSDATQADVDNILTYNLNLSNEADSYIDTSINTELVDTLNNSDELDINNIPIDFGDYYVTEQDICVDKEVVWPQENTDQVNASQDQEVVPGALYVEAVAVVGKPDEVTYKVFLKEMVNDELVTTPLDLPPDELQAVIKHMIPLSN